MGIIVSTRDVQLEGLDKTLYEIILDNSPDPIFCFAPDGTYLYINQGFSSAFGLMPSDIIGKRIWDIFPGEQGDMRFAAVKRAFETKEEVVLDVKVDAVGGDRYYITTCTPIMDEQGVPRVVICSSKEITLRKQMEMALKDAKEETELKNARLDMAVKELYHKSITDALTKLYNRQHIIEMLEEDIAKFDRRNYDLFLAFLDIDHFKEINDLHGHVAGDQALVEFTTLMKREFEFLGYSGRYGGEEFIVILPNIGLEEGYKMIEAFRKVIESSVFTDAKIKFTFSAGVKVYGNEGLDEFLNRTDALMYEAKAGGRNQIKKMGQ